jgi:SAM-dependent methyltransferase
MSISGKAAKLFRLLPYVVGKRTYLAEVLRCMSGTVTRTCPICAYHGRFEAFGMPPRFDAVCGRCGSLERHRLFVLKDQQHQLLSGQGAMLHFAPERHMTEYFRPRVGRYVTADLMRDDVDLNLNIEAMEVENESFDLVYCSHVLEHVDDAKAMREMHRILRPGGAAICAVPLVGAWATTYENAAVTSGAGRELHFGQWDHVRWYGRDFVDRLQQAGFSTTEYTCTGEEAVLHGLLRHDQFYVCHK